MSLRELEKSPQGARVTVLGPSLHDPLSVAVHARDIAMTFTEPVVDAPSNVAAEAMPVEKDLELQRQEVHPSLNIQHGLELWERVREYDARAAAEASATKEELLPVLTRNQKQKLKVQHVLATQPHKPRPRGNNQPSSQ